MSCSLRWLRVLDGREVVGLQRADAFEAYAESIPWFLALRTGQRTYITSMKLYHFIQSNFGIEDIKRRRIRISRINDLNDPFEFLAYSLEDPTQRSKFRKVKDEFHKNRGIICFSQNWWNPVIWSHYADKHKGMCLGFEVENSFVEQVAYSAQRLKLDVEQFTKNAILAEQMMQKCILTKFNHWGYEQEWRAFFRLDHSMVDLQGNYFYDFDANIKLTEIIVGAESRVTRSDIQAALKEGGYDYEITTFKARPAFKTFQVVRNKNEELWE